MACELEKNLIGYSGCLLQIIKTDGHFSVRKQANTDAYNCRLRMQCAKQKWYHRYSTSSVATPRITNYGYLDQLFYFDMDFIYCKNLSEMLPFLPTRTIYTLIEKLFQHINTIAKRQEGDACQTFQNKIGNLCRSVPMDSLKKECFSLLKNYDFSTVEKSICHGDLTLENILVTEDYSLFLIDFLDSFYNSYLIDLAKLFQDLELGWAYRNKSNDTTREIRLLIAKNYLQKQILDMPDGEHRIATVYHILLLNILRIYPYTNATKTLEFLDCCCEKVLKKIGDFK